MGALNITCRMGDGMDNILIKRAAIQSLVLMMVIIVGTYLYNRESHLVESYANDSITIDGKAPAEEREIEKKIKPIKTIQDEKEEEHPFYSKEDFKFADKEILKLLDDQYIIIKKPKNKKVTMTLENRYINKSLLLTLQGADNEDVDTSLIGRVNNSKFYFGQVVYLEYNKVIEATGSDDVAHEVIRDYGYDIVREINIRGHEILIELDHVYEAVVLEDDKYFYIDLKKPREIYDNILVIDAGHGGRDPGAISLYGNHYEKDFNLRILLSLKKLLDSENIKVYYTRLDDQQLYLRPRVELANDLDSDFFISIHCNSNLKSGPNGTEILYYDNEFNNIRTKDLAEIFSNQLDVTTSLRRKGLEKRKEDDIFILENAQVPAVLIEVGYLSNYNDLEYLKKQDNIDKVAQGIYQGILSAYKEIED